MTMILSGDAGVTFPAGGLGNPASAVVGLTDTQTLTNKSVVATQLTGTVAVARLPAGSVLQVVSATYSTLVTTSIATFVDTGLTATITPTSATSKILILVGHPNTYKGGPVTISMGVKLFRGATDLGKIIDQTSYNSSGNMFVVSFNYYDSPSSTSALVYKTQFNSEGALGIVNVQSNNYPSTMTLMEISA